MLKHRLSAFFFLVCTLAVAQSSFRRLSRPEKCWVLMHPFKARKAQKITLEVTKVVDSVKLAGTIGVDGNGGKLDAFRHAYWMADLACTIGARQAGKLGRAHEKGNYRQFRKHLLEDSALPDSVSCEMDLRNNEAGIRIATDNHCSLTHTYLKAEILQRLEKGELFVISKDAAGNYLDCQGALLDMKTWSGKWNIPKCIIPSAQH